MIASNRDIIPEGIAASTTDTEKLANEVSLKGLFVKNMLERINNAFDGEREALQNALKLGLRAFGSEVAYNED